MNKFGTALALLGLIAIGLLVLLLIGVLDVEEDGRENGNRPLSTLSTIDGGPWT